MPKSLKPATTAAQQIALLRFRGMEVEHNLAEQWLSNVGYYRLSAYWYPAWLSHGDSQHDKFRPGTSFAHAVELYEADRKLRTLIHDGVERVEVAMRT